MNRSDKYQLLAQRSALEKMIAETHPDEVLDLKSLQTRLVFVNQQISKLPVDERLPAKAKLTFRGRPVVGSHGIFAEFGLSATKAFADAVSMVAAGLSSPLASTGPIPNRDQNQLLITNTATGSFGFELEEHGNEELPLAGESTVSAALKKTQELLAGSLGSDDELAEAATGTDPRAVAAVRAFLDTLTTNEAVCAVEMGDYTFRFKDVGEVRRSWERLGQDNLREEVLTVEGEFQGVLPKRRTFEFKLTDSGDVIVGKIGATINDPDVLNNHLHTLVKLGLLTIRVGGGRPRYLLEKLPEW
jgi:hypothetical protein